MDYRNPVFVQATAALVDGLVDDRCCTDNAYGRAEHEALARMWRAAAPLEVLPPHVRPAFVRFLAAVSAHRRTTPREALAELAADPTVVAEWLALTVLVARACETPQLELTAAADTPALTGGGYL